MRPSNKPTGAVWRLLAEWSRNHPLRPNQTQMAGLFEVSTSLLSDWKYMQSVMQPDDMTLIAERTGIELALITRAVAEDKRSAEADGGRSRLSARRSSRRPPQGPQVQEPD